MKYILDFDEVIFNTTALKKKLSECGIAESTRSAGVFDEIKRRDPSFKIENLVFDEVMAFLQNHRGDCEIVSSYISTDPTKTTNENTQRLYHEEKIKRSGIANIVGQEHVHVVGKSKAEVLSELKRRFDSEGEDCVFVDDRKEYVEEAQTLGIQAFWMRKEYVGGSFEGAKEHREYNKISSLKELET